MGIRRRRLQAVTERAGIVADALSGMSDDHLLCRDLGHPWRPYTAQWIPQRREFEEQLRCPRCKTVRVRLLDERGGLLANQYRYADGYQVEGMGRLTGDDRDAVRLAGLHTLLRVLERKGA